MGQITLLAALVRGDVDDVYPELAASPAAADDFRAFLAYHQLLGFVAHVLSDHPQREKMPTGLLDDLSVHARKLGWKNDKVRGTLPMIASAFRQADVPFILLKGLHFAMGYYGGMERRTFWDMDILVNPANLDQAQRQLSSLGYVKTSRVFISDRFSRFYTHAYDYRKPRGLDIDLHWKLANHPGLKFDYQAIWASRQTLSLEGTPFSVLSETDALSFLLIGIVKDIERGSLRLRSIVDLYTILQFMDAETDWTRFFEDRRSEGTESICVGALHVFFAAFQIRPEEFPRLQEEARVRSSPGLDQAQALALIQPQRYAIKNKIWASELYAMSCLAYHGWWVISLPARLVVHRTVPKPKKSRK